MPRTQPCCIRSMATTSERIKNLDCSSSVWVTKDQREAGLKYLVEKHARQGAAITARTLSGLVVNAEEEAARQEAAKSQKRQREGELNELVEEMAKADGEVKAQTTSLFSGIRQGGADAKKKKPSVLAPHIPETRWSRSRKWRRRLETQLVRRQPRRRLPLLPPRPQASVSAPTTAAVRRMSLKRTERRLDELCTRFEAANAPKGPSGLAITATVHSDQSLRHGENVPVTLKLVHTIAVALLFSTMAAADVQQQPRDEEMQTYTLEQETAPTLDRTESQVEKQLKVHQVQQRLAGQQQPVRELLAAAGSPAPRSEAPAEMLEEIIRQQKTARNIGEDLLEDMLKLDSLAGLFQADREVRKLALSQLDDLVDQVDTAKAQLLKKRKELEAMVADEVAADANPAQLEKEVSPPQSPAAESMEPEASRSQNESPRLEDIRCRLRLRSQERPQGYVVSANARGVSAEDVDLQLDGDLLRITGFARPTLQDAAFLRSRLRREPSVEETLGNYTVARLRRLRFRTIPGSHSSPGRCRRKQDPGIVPRWPAAADFAAQAAAVPTELPLFAVEATNVPSLVSKTERCDMKSKIRCTEQV
eukprot:s1950_g8.t2